jgi:hypothetical protein
MLRRIAQFASVVAAFCTVATVGAGCLDRPVTSSGATTKTNFTASVTQNAIDKVDLLFDIDNSASMGDKQAYLAQAVPDLVTRLVQPNCVIVTAGSMAAPVVKGKSNNGSCSAYPGTTIEFPPVHNMHIGVISSSLGTRGVTGGGQVCDPSGPGSFTNNDAPFGSTPPHAAISAHEDDRAELLNRTSTDVYTEGTSPATGGQNFLDWFPTVPANVGKTPTNGVAQALSPQATVLTMATGPSPSGLEADFADLIIGSHYYGCGIESQLESWYRFLVQPDPYDSIVIDSSGHAQWNNVDATIIKQRHDFLRPDSLVAIIDLTDENDSEIDVRSFGGQGYKFMDQTFPPPHGTSQCATDPSATASGSLPGCTSCAYCSGGAPASICGDPACKAGANTYTATDDPGFYINVRHVHMMQKYGIVPQFPLGRYVLGLTSQTVPDRFHEYPNGATSYQGGTVYDTTKNPPVLTDPQNLSCLNPLFAASLPDGSDLSPGTLCNKDGLVGTRTADLIFYAHIGGVPHQLLQSTPGAPDGLCPMGTAPQDCPQKDTILPTDWTKILGQGWETIPSPPSAPNVNQYNYTGIDPHMIESFEPRPTIVALDPPGPQGGGPDMINGGDWVTDTVAGVQHELPVDREYACIFPLVDTTGTATPRDCTSPDYSITDACDCSKPGLSKSAIPAVCGLNSAGTDYTTQYYAKTYPTIRELELAALMGTQGIISSLCPIHTVDMLGGNDPLYGYRPAITAIVNRLKNALATQCLPEQLSPDTSGSPNKGASNYNPSFNDVPCLVLATLPLIDQNKIANQHSVCNDMNAGISPATTSEDIAILKTFQESQHATWKAAGNTTALDPSEYSTCLVNQIPWNPNGSCAVSKAGGAGFCYVTDRTYTGTCAQAIQFTAGSPPEGSVVSLQCIEAQANIIGADAGGGG